MTPVLSFTAGQFGRAIVRLGDIVIGEVAAHNGAGARATFLLSLPECQASFRPATSIDEARRTIAREIEEWLLRAGIFYPGQEVQIELRNGDCAWQESKAG